MKKNHTKLIRPHIIKYFAFPKPFQQSINKMNTNLHDIQADIQRLTQQQNQIHAQTIQAQQLLQAQQIASLLNQVK